MRTDYLSFQLQREVHFDHFRVSDVQNINEFFSGCQELNLQKEAEPCQEPGTDSFKETSKQVGGLNGDPF